MRWRNMLQQKSKKARATFGNKFFYNKVYYTKFEDQHATIEEFLSGNFFKYVNNNAHWVLPPEPLTQDEKIIYEKAGTLVHYSYALSEKKMLIDIQGSGYALCDPEIATQSLKDDDDSSEILFCCGNLSTMAIHGFLAEHSCN